MQLPGDPGYRSDLPPIPSERRPVGYSSGWQLEERLLGLGAVVLGLAGLFVVYGVVTGFLPAGLPPPPQPKGILLPVPTINAAACFTPFLTLSSLGLIFFGARRLIDP